MPFSTRTKCTEGACQREKKEIISANYYFPSWAPFAPRMISLMKTWNGFDRPQLHVKFPRVIPPASELFVLAQKGNIPGVQRLFSDKKASPYDISAGEGRSALHVSLNDGESHSSICKAHVVQQFALTANQPQMARFLIKDMAEFRLIDNYSLSPIDTLWNYILDDAEKPEYVAFKKYLSKF
ncbi:hypothetical protein ANO14919_097930 [Xylariales sp. No.14919]|nr:hypothetical protein ANO14919_097930 [Xylariales sp. No.14919]